MIRQLDRQRAKLVVFAGGVLILTIGSLLAPRPSPTATQIVEPAAPLLEEQLRSEEPGRLFDTLRDTARQATESLVAIERPALEAASPVGSWSDWTIDVPAGPSGLVGGLIVSAQGDILTAAAAAAHGSPLRIRFPDGERLAGRVTALDSDAALALVRIDDAGGRRWSPPLMGIPAPGQFVLAVGLKASGRFLTPATLEATESDAYQLVTAPPSLPPGATVIDSGGAALAIVVGTPERQVAYPVGRALDRITRLTEEGRALPTAIGVSLQEVGPELEPFFGSAGVIVRDVAAASPAAGAGVRPGDVLAAVGGVAVEGPEDAMRRLRLLPAGEPTAVAVMRRGIRREIAIAAESVVEARWTGRAPQPPTGARRAGEVFDAGVLARAAIPADGWVLSVDNGAPRRGTRVARPMLVYLDANGVRYFAAVGPGA